MSSTATTCPRCGAYPFGCVRGCGGKPQQNENERVQNGSTPTSKDNND